MPKPIPDPIDLPPQEPSPSPVPVPGQAVGPPPASSQFTITLESIHISKTRSPRTDTDTVYFGLKVGQQDHQPFIKPMGDLSDGDYPLGLSFPNVSVALDDHVAFTYLVVNSGYDQSNESQVNEVTGMLADVGGDILNNWAPGFGSLVAFAIKKLSDIFNANCDGVVIAEKIAADLPLQQSPLIPIDYTPPPGTPIPPLTGFSLWEWTAEGPLRITREFPGTNSNVGCGENSLYYLTWSISRDS